MKKHKLAILVSVFTLIAVLSGAGTVFAAQASATLRVSCTILPVLQVSSQSLTNPQNNAQSITTQTLRETSQGFYQITSVTAL
jgi:hypothetical protein